MASDFMNPSAVSNVCPNSAADFVGRHYLQSLHNDGVPMKIIAEGNWMGADLNQEAFSIRNTLDETLWNERTALVAALLRANSPSRRNQDAMRTCLCRFDWHASLSFNLWDQHVACMPGATGRQECKRYCQIRDASQPLSGRSIRRVTHEMK
jgi:hypothetical protein